MSAGRCPACGAPLAAGAGPSDCPSCLLAIGLDDPGPEEFPEVPGVELLSRIGHGGSGEVFRARDRATGELVAVKVLSEEWSADPELRARTLREAETLARLDHPGLVRCRRYGEEGDRIHLVLELVEGTSLRKALEAGPLPPDRVRRLGLELADVLHRVHEAGVVHRDVKPENVLLEASGRARLLDFGIARSEAGGRGLTGAGHRLGTPYYLAPEQLAAPDTADRRADLYSLGVVLYEALTGELPIGRFEPPSRRVNGVPRGWDGALARALAREPANRFRDAREMGRALASTGERHRRWPIPIAAAAGFAALVAIGRSLPPRPVVGEVVPPAPVRDDAELHRGLARTFEALGKFEEAVAEWRAAARLAPHDAAVHEALGRCLARQGYLARLEGDRERVRLRLDGARAAFERAMELDPGGPARLRLDQGNALEAAFARDDREAALAACREGSAESRGTEVEVEFLWLLGLLAADEEATQALDRAIEIAPGHAIARFVRAFARRSTDPEGALEDFGHAILAWPSWPAPLAARGTLRLERGDADGAVADLDDALAVRPADPTTLMNRGVAHGDRGEHDLAIADFTAALALAPSADLHVNRARSLGDAGRADEALRDLDVAVRLEPGNGTARSDRGVLRAERHDLPGAIEAFTAAIEAEPARASHRFNRGLAREDSGLTEDAILDYDEALRLAPRHAKARGRRGILHAGRGEWDLARGDLLAAIELLPEDDPDAALFRRQLRAIGPDER